MPGSLEILNVAAGDTKITFNTKDCRDAIRARRIITDMLRRGYALVVEVDRNGEKAYERIKEFDEAQGEYIIADFDDRQVQETRAIQTSGVVTPEPSEGLCPCGKPTKHKGRCLGSKNHATRRLPMDTTKATGIGRTAGG